MKASGNATVQGSWYPPLKSPSKTQNPKYYGESVSRGPWVLSGKLHPSSSPKFAQSHQAKKTRLSLQFRTHSLNISIAPQKRLPYNFSNRSFSYFSKERVGWLERVVLAYIHLLFRHWVISYSFVPVDWNPSGSSVRGISKERILRVGCHFLLHGIFPTQGLNPGPCMAGGFLDTQPRRKPPIHTTMLYRELSLHAVMAV